tara:strand:- start:1753 stop:2421 length:669 start_codon:yes stop_codon:yes gene_type:complete
MNYQNYRRTTTCSFCFKPGHNKRSCSTRKEWLLSKLDTGNEEEKSWAKRELEGIRIRKCSFCRGVGHTRPKCEKRHREIRLHAADCLSARRKVLSNILKGGLGIGSLVSFEVEIFDNLRSRWTKQSYVGLVNNILWDEITHLVILGERMERREIISVEFFDQSGERDDAFCRLPEQVANINNSFLRADACEVSIVSPVKDIAYPENFLSFESCFKQVSRWYK